MGTTTFSGPVNSTAGFVGDVVGAIKLPTFTVANAPSAATAGERQRGPPHGRCEQRHQLDCFQWHRDQWHRDRGRVMARMKVVIDWQPPSDEELAARGILPTRAKPTKATKKSKG